MGVYYYKTIEKQDMPEEPQFIGDRSVEEISDFFSDAEMAITLEEGNAMQAVEMSVVACPECVNYSEMDTTLLHSAAGHGYPEMIAYLVEAGAEINRVVDGEMPLGTAIMGRKVDNVNTLLALGAEPMHENADISPVITAIWRCDCIVDGPLMLQALIDAGADLTYQYKTREDDWWDALTYAMYCRNDNAVEIISKELRKTDYDVDGVMEEYQIISKLIDERIDFERYARKNIGKIAEYITTWDIEEQVFHLEDAYDINKSVGIYGLYPKGKKHAILLTTGVRKFTTIGKDKKEYVELMMQLPKEWVKDENLLKREEHRWLIEMIYKVIDLPRTQADVFYNEDTIIRFDSLQFQPMDGKSYVAVKLTQSEEFPYVQLDWKTKVNLYNMILLTEEEISSEYEN